VAVDPDHDRVGEVTAQLDEPGADLVIPHLEEVAAHPPFGLLEPVPGWARLAVVAPSVLAAEHPLELLPHPDRDHPGPPGGLGGVQVGRITSALPCSLAKRTTGMPLALAKRATAARNRSPIGVNNAGDGIGLPRCWVKNATTCPPTCRLGT
jgi:hypothetical protein